MFSIFILKYGYLSHSAFVIIHRNLQDRIHNWLSRITIYWWAINRFITSLKLVIIRLKEKNYLQLTNIVFRKMMYMAWQRQFVSIVKMARWGRYIARYDELPKLLLVTLFLAFLLYVRCLDHNMHKISISIIWMYLSMKIRKY